VTAKEWTGTPRPEQAASHTWGRPFCENGAKPSTEIDYNCGFKENYNKEKWMAKAFYQMFCIE
jgi:hypothetical protein